MCGAIFCTFLGVLYYGGKMQIVDGNKMRTAITNKKRKHEIEMQWKYIGETDGQFYGISKKGNKYVAFVEFSVDTLEKNGLFIDNFEVCKSCRKSGVGKKAFEDIVELGKQHGAESIRLMAKDDVSKLFWVKMGFECEYDNYDGISMKYMM